MEANLVALSEFETKQNLDVQKKELWNANLLALPGRTKHRYTLPSLYDIYWYESIFFYF